VTRSTVVANRRLYTVSGLEPRRRGSMFQAVVAAQLVDDPTGTPVAAVRVTTSFPGLRSRTASSGFVGLVGDPSRALPGLATRAYDVDVVLEANGYAPRRETASFGVQPGFPTSFTPVDLGAVPMRRLPVDVRVGTYELDASNRPRPLAGATVSVTGHWRHVTDLGSGPGTDDLVAVTPGLRAPRPAGAAIDLPPLNQPAEPPRTLMAAAAAGATRVAVSNTGGLVAGDLVGLDLGDPERAERIEIVAVEGPADLQSPAELELRFPLAVGHRDGAPATRIVPGPALPSTFLVAEALAGDRTLTVGSLTGLAGQVVRVGGGGAASEYCTARRYELTTNSDGAGRFPPMTGMAAIEVSAVSGTLGETARVTLTQTSPAVDLTFT
jgi:hypothetical protein